MSPISPAQLTELAESFLATVAQPRTTFSLKPYFSPDRSKERESLEAARRWRQLIFDAGFGWLTGPTELGGRGLTVEHELAWRRVLANYEVPDEAPYFGISLGMVAPAIASFAPYATQAELLPQMYRGDLIACQLFSEAEAGSDLAAVATTAWRKSPDEWRIEGEKIWITGAHFSDFGLVLARLAAEEDGAATQNSRRHDGLVALLVPLDQPAVAIERLEQPPGSASFCRVTLANATTKDAWRLGEPGEGWLVAMATLAGERGSIGLDATAMSALDPRVILELVYRYGDCADARLLAEVGEVLAHLLSTRWTAERAAREHEMVGLPGPAGLAAKLGVGDSFERVADLASELLELGLRPSPSPANPETELYPEPPACPIHGGKPLLRGRLPERTSPAGHIGFQDDLAAWRSLVQSAHVFKIAGGTDEIVRSILAERYLGLTR